MVAALRSWILAVVDRSWMFGRQRPNAVPKNDIPKIGAYPVDYSEPTQEEIDAANASCTEVVQNRRLGSDQPEVVICALNGV
jgi:hypothetical protein